MHGKTMEVFWFDGTGDGIITAELSNWNGEAIKRLYSQSSGNGIIELVMQNDEWI